jgi:protein-L-isoaspartate(D-aspartate) O-methyltransferase
MTLEDCRQFYAEEIRFAANVSTPALIEAFASVPRDKFLGPPPWQIGSAARTALSMAGAGGIVYQPADDPRSVYHNVVIALDAAREVNNGQPSALACWIDALDLKPGERVYHLGCGVGYYTAIMAEVVGPGGSVTGAEVVPDLAARARENLAGYPNVTVHAGDGAAFDPGAHDAILINAGVTHPHPAWLDRLREGGRLVLPLTMSVKPNAGVGVMLKIIRDRTAFSVQLVSAVGIYPCTAVRDTQLEPAIKKALSTGTLPKVKSVRCDPHEEGEGCVIHGAGVCLSTAEPVAAHEAAAS